MSINKNLFDTLPIGFFNCLASGSSNRIYSDCLLLIYHEYDREITYRIARSRELFGLDLDSFSTVHQILLSCQMIRLLQD